MNERVGVNRDPSRDAPGRVIGFALATTRPGATTWVDGRLLDASGAVIAYSPTRQGDTVIWAIYILGDIQMGLWQR